MKIYSFYTSNLKELFNFKVWILVKTLNLAEISISICVSIPAMKLILLGEVMQKTEAICICFWLSVDEIFFGC